MSDQWSPKPRKSCYCVTAPAILVSLLNNQNCDFRVFLSRATSDLCLGNHWAPSVLPLWHDRRSTSTNGDHCITIQQWFYHLGDPWPLFVRPLAKTKADASSRLTVTFATDRVYYVATIVNPSGNRSKFVPPSTSYEPLSNQPLGDFCATTLNMFKHLRRSWQPCRFLNILCTTFEWLR